jgi:hypothetical protein
VVDLLRHRSRKRNHAESEAYVKEQTRFLPAVRREPSARWIQDGNMGVLACNDAYGRLGWDADDMRRAIFSPVGRRD